MTSAKNSCSYLGCGSTNGMTLSDGQRAKFFRIPRNERRSKEWAINIGRPHFMELTLKQRHNRFVCIKHFDLVNMFTCTSLIRLKKDAFPEKHPEWQEIHEKYLEAVSSSDLIFNSIDLPLVTYSRHKQETTNILHSSSVVRSRGSLCRTYSRTLTSARGKHGVSSPQPSRVALKQGGLVKVGKRRFIFNAGLQQLTMIRHSGNPPASTSKSVSSGDPLATTESECKTSGSHETTAVSTKQSTPSNVKRKVVLVCQSGPSKKLKSSDLSSGINVTSGEETEKSTMSDITASTSGDKSTGCNTTAATIIKPVENTVKSTEISRTSPLKINTGCKTTVKSSAEKHFACNIIDGPSTSALVTAKPMGGKVIKRYVIPLSMAADKSLEFVLPKELTAKPAAAASSAGTSADLLVKASGHATLQTRKGQTKKLIRLSGPPPPSANIIRINVNQPRATTVQAAAAADVRGVSTKQTAIRSKKPRHSRDVAAREDKGGTDLELLPVNLPGVENMEVFDVEPGPNVRKLPRWIEKGARVQDLCRVCANASNSMVKIFSAEGKRRNLAATMTQYLPMNVGLHNAHMPQQVCTSCVGKLEACKDFLEMFARGEKELQTLAEEEEKSYESPLEPLEESRRDEATDAGLTTDFTENESDSEPEVGEGYLDMNPKLGSKKLGFYPKKHQKPPKGLVIKKNPNKERKKSINKWFRARPDIDLENNPPLMTCSMCYKVCGTIYDLKIHYYRTHHCTLCYYCGEVFRTFEECQEHKNKSHKAKCKFCEFHSSSKTCMRDHIRTKHKDIEVRFIKLRSQKPQYYRVDKCKFCRLTKALGSKYAAKYHYYWRHQVYCCDVCLEMYETRDEQEKHTDEVHALVCGMCDERFYNQTHLNVHIDEEHIERPIDIPPPKKSENQVFECAYCQKGLSTLVNLKLHCYFVHNKVSCDFCETQFNKIEVADQHYKEAHFNGQCPYCDVMFSDFETLDTHLETVHADKGTYTCEYCAKYFSSRSQLRAHRTEHVQFVKTYHCPICDQTIEGSSKIQTHKTMHRGTKDKKTKEIRCICEFCSKGFSKMSGLKRHLKMHENKRNKYKCVDCGLQYSSLKTLKKHLQHHKMESKYVCNICDLKFIMKANLVKHMQLKHSSFIIENVMEDYESGPECVSGV